MDLSVSPDIEAFWSYLIVLLLGLFVAYRQVTSRLEGFKDIWLVGDTWILFFAYVAIPLGLFWLLDRTDAVKDSSLFAALLVGIGYERILAGTNGTLAAPQGLGSYWSPFVAYANRVAEKIRDAARRADRRLQKRLLANILADPARYEALEELAKSLTPNVAALDQELAAVDADAHLGPGAKRERKAGILYEEVRAADDFLYELRAKSLVTRGWYAWHAHQLGSKLSALLVGLVLAGAVLYVRHQASVPQLDVDYALWRMEKPNASSSDLFRAERRLMQRLHDIDAAIAAYAFRGLGERLRAPEPVLARIDSLLHVALNSRCAARRSGVELPALLVEALTAGNADVRARVQRALVYLSEGQRAEPPADLRDWSPSEGDSVTDLQRRIAQWHDYWRAVSPADWADCAPTKTARKRSMQPLTLSLSHKARGEGLVRFSTSC
jgi:hypothetical protein